MPLGPLCFLCLKQKTIFIFKKQAKVNLKNSRVFLLCPHSFFKRVSIKSHSLSGYQQRIYGVFSNNKGKPSLKERKRNRKGLQSVRVTGCIIPSLWGEILLSVVFDFFFWNALQETGHYWNVTLCCLKDSENTVHKNLRFNLLLAVG